MFQSRKPLISFLRLALILGLLLAVTAVASAEEIESERPDRPIPTSISDLMMSEMITNEAGSLLANVGLDPSLRGATGRQQVILRLDGAGVAAVAAEGVSRPVQINRAAAIDSQHADVIKSVLAADPTAIVLGQARVAVNAVMVEVDAAALSGLAASGEILSIAPIGDYEMSLDETVPYIGATTVQNNGYDGAGIKVAVLDSGIDYTHANLGGEGTLDAYNAAYSDPASRDGLFPTADVVEGMDFVGEVWPFGPLATDDDPIDFQGHGSHVADIIGGDGGVAPGVDLYAVKVCSAVATSCSGVALILAMDYSIDPNGDGDISDRVDIINMSLGSNYGQPFDDDLSQAVENASALGVLTVSSAGNGSDKPYIVGSPSAAPSALAVAQTNVPSAFAPQYELTAPASATGIYDAAFQTWSAPLTDVIEAPVIYGDGAGGNLNGCAPFTTDLSGYIVLVDRGACNFTAKIFNIANAGGELGIIGLVAPGLPFSGGFADPGGPITISGYMISQADSNTIKAGLPDTVARFDPSVGNALVGSMVGSSSRGPGLQGNTVKPEIGAPGASVSAQAGTGDGETAFGGTSGASPMVAGSAALVLQAAGGHGALAPHETKAMLVNNAETNILNTVPGELAPISRIGGGEVRVDRAVSATMAAWDADSLESALSFGYHDVSTSNITLYRDVTVHNYTDQNKVLEIGYNFRFENDYESNAVGVSTPHLVYVDAYGDATFRVYVTVWGKHLHDWGLDSGANAVNSALATLSEYDGYITITDKYDDDDSIHLPWLVVPRAAGYVVLGGHVRPDGSARVLNWGVGETTIETYSLIGLSDNLPEGPVGGQAPITDFRYLGYTTIPVPAGVCSASDSFILGFAINTWERQTMAIVPNAFEIDLDTNQDGIFDYAILNADLGGIGGIGDGRNVVWAVDLATGAQSAFFFTDHETNSGNTVLYVCGEQIGMNAANFFQPMDVQALAVDIYFTGNVTDFMTGITISPLGEQYLASFAVGGVGSTTLAQYERDYVSVLDFGQTTNNTEVGLLALYRGGAQPNNEALAAILTGP